MSFGYVLARAVEGRTAAVLDWGGGIGQYAMLAKALLPDCRLDYWVVELLPAVTVGRSLNSAVTFVDELQDVQRYDFDLVMASGSLQCVQDWKATLKRLIGHSRKYVFVTRLPTVRHARSYVATQQPYHMGYRTEYAGWVINRGDLLATTRDGGVSLCREFIVDENHTIPGAPEQPCYRGFLFKRVS
jgi:putative methyltransferase (TIGR04325 family)